MEPADEVEEEQELTIFEADQEKELNKTTKEVSKVIDNFFSSKAQKKMAGLDLKSYLKEMRYMLEEVDKINVEQVEGIKAQVAEREDYAASEAAYNERLEDLQASLIDSVNEICLKRYEDAGKTKWEDCQKKIQDEINISKENLREEVKQLEDSQAIFDNFVVD